MKKMEFLGLMRTEDFYFVYSALVQAERIVYHRNFSYHYRKDNVNGLENNSDLSPVSFWDATLMLKEHLQSLSYYKELEVAFLHSAVRRFSYNFFRMNSYEGFCKVFYLLKEVAESDLQLSNRKLYKEVAQEYAVLKDAVSYDRAEDYLYEKFLERKGSLRKHKEEMQLQKRRYEALKHSAEYRAGRVLLFVPRKIVNACSFLGEHGLRMTLDYGLGKIRRIFFRKK